MSSDLKFNQEQYRRPISRQPKKTLTDKLIDWKIAKNEKQAKLILLVVAVIALLITAYNLFSLSGDNKADNTPIDPMMMESS